MKLTKEKLKRIIKEEVIKKLLEQDDDITFREPGLSRRDFLKRLGAGAAMATGVGVLDKMVDTDKEARAAALQARREKAAETLESDEYLLENLITFLGQSVNFSWSWSANEDSKSLGSGEGFSQPEDFPVLGDREWGTLLILSPEYGVARKVYDDVRKQIENKQELKPTIDIENTIRPQGDAKFWNDNFFRFYGVPDPSTRNMENPDQNIGVYDKYLNEGFRSKKLRDGVYLLWTPWEITEPTMVMPTSLMSPSEYYSELWEKFVELRGKSKK